MTAYFIGLFLLVFTSVNVFSQYSKATDRPNVIVIYTDDQDLEETGCYGGTVATPHMDRLANEGVRFTNYYPSSSVCTPSRYSVLTGQYASRSRSMQQEHPTSGHAFVRWNTDLIPGDMTIAHYMKANGYVTGFVGKWHNWYKGHPPFYHVPDRADPKDPKIMETITKNYEIARNYIKESAGFEHVSNVYANNFSWLPITKKLMYHNQHWITHGAIRFIEEHKKGPFFLYVATTLPHSPKAEASLTNNPETTPLGYLKGHQRAQPSYQSVLNRAKTFKNQHSDATEMLADMIWLDDGIGAIMAKLDELGLRENTLIILASDHESKAKMTLNQGRAPFIMSWKGKIKANQVNDALVSNIDICPTILDACGIESPTSTLDGTSLLPLFHKNNPSWRESLYMEVTYTRAVVTKDWKYIALRFPEHIAQRITEENRREFNQEGASYSIGSSNESRVRYDSDKKFPGYYDHDQLYDLRKDPGEQNNLAKNPEYKTVMSKMKSELKKYSQQLPHRFGEFK